MSKNIDFPEIYDVLIVDDSSSMGFLLTDIITTKGHSAKWVNNFQHAMEELNKHKPKVILLDVNMPDLNGYKFCEMLKAEKKYDNILVYYLTGVSKDQIQIKVLETKADGYLSKPFQMSDLDDILEYVS